MQSGLVTADLTSVLRRAASAVVSHARRVATPRTPAIAVLVGERASDVVEPVQQALALERVEIERDLAARRIDDQLPLEVDLGGCAAVDRVDQRAELGGREDDRDEADLEAVHREDVAERRRDHDLEAVVLERPGRVLAGGAAAEVRTGDQDLRTGDSPGRSARSPAGADPLRRGASRRRGTARSRCARSASGTAWG